MSSSTARQNAREPFANAPSFFVIGAQRAGTTRLCHLLDAHPTVCIPTKEPFYFNDPVATVQRAHWYRSLFANAPPASIYGEGSTYYSMCDTFPETARRIFEFNPNARIIYMIRHPLRRIESAWFQLLSTRELSGLKSFRRSVMQSNALIEPTLYWKQLSSYRRYFPDDQIHVGVFEDFARDEASVLAKCLAFLGVDAGVHPDGDPAEGRNVSAGKLQPRAAVDLVKAVPGYQRLKHAIPERWRIVLGGRLQKPITSKATWDPELIRYVDDRIAEDCRAMLDHLALPPDYWDLTNVAVDQ
jgi:hypothetical protein